MLLIAEATSKVQPLWCRLNALTRNNPITFTTDSHFLFLFIPLYKAPSLIIHIPYKLYPLLSHPAACSPCHHPNRSFILFTLFSLFYIHFCQASHILRFILFVSYAINICIHFHTFFSRQCFSFFLLPYLFFSHSFYPVYIYISLSLFLSSFSRKTNPLMQLSLALTLSPSSPRHSPSLAHWYKDFRREHSRIIFSPSAFYSRNRKVTNQYFMCDVTPFIYIEGKDGQMDGWMRGWVDELDDKVDGDARCW